MEEKKYIHVQMESTLGEPSSEEDLPKPRNPPTCRSRTQKKKSLLYTKKGRGAQNTLFPYSSLSNCYSPCQIDAVGDPPLEDAPPPPTTVHHLVEKAIRRRHPIYVNALSGESALGDHPPLEDAPPPLTTAHLAVKEAISGGGCRLKQKKVVSKKSPLHMPPPQQSEAAHKNFLIDDSASSGGIFFNAEASLAASPSLPTDRARPFPPPVTSIPRRADSNLSDNRENLQIPGLSASATMDRKIKKKPKKTFKKTFTHFTQGVSNLTNKLANLFPQTENSNASENTCLKRNESVNSLYGLGNEDIAFSERSRLERQYSINSLYGSSGAFCLGRHESVNSLYESSEQPFKRHVSVNSLYEFSEGASYSSTLFLPPEKPEYANSEEVQNSMRQPPRNQEDRGSLFGP